MNNSIVFYKKLCDLVRNLRTLTSSLPVHSLVRGKLINEVTGQSGLKSEYQISHNTSKFEFPNGYKFMN